MPWHEPGRGAQGHRPRGALRRRGGVTSLAVDDLVSMEAVRTLCPGHEATAVSLGGAMLGGVSSKGADSILAIARDAGIKLVDTSSAYGDSEWHIGLSDSNMLGELRICPTAIYAYQQHCIVNGRRHHHSTSSPPPPPYASPHVNEHPHPNALPAIFPLQSPPSLATRAN